MGEEREMGRELRKGVRVGFLKELENFEGFIVLISFIERDW